MQRQRHVRFNKAVEPQLFTHHQRQIVGADVVHHLARRELSRFDFQLLRLNFREVENIADDFQQQAGGVVHCRHQPVDPFRQLFGLQQVEVTDDPVQRRSQLVADGGKEHGFRLAGLLRGLRHLLQRLFHLHARGDIHQHANRHVFIAIAGMHKADLQVGVRAGEHVDKVHLLTADNLRQPLSIFVRQHVQVVMRQLVTQDVGSVLGTQNTNPHRRRRDNLPVKLLVFLQPLGVAFGRNKDFPLIHARQGKQRPARDQVQQNRIHDENTYPLKHHIHRQRIDNTQRRRRQALLQHQLAEARGIAKPRPLLHPVRFNV